MEISAPALLRLTARPRYWRIAVILPGRILWRTYSRAEYSTPDDAVRRCLAGLVLPSGIQPQTDQHSEECRHGYAEPCDRLPAIDDDEATQHPRPLSPVRAAWWGWLLLLAQ